MYDYSLATNGRSHLMLNTVKRDKRKANKALYENMLNEHSMIQEMKSEIARLQEELNMNKFNQEEADKNKEILGNLYDKQIIDHHGNLK